MSAAGGLGTRTAALEKLEARGTGEPFDVLVIGGGITGAGVAVDAASRGLSTALVEREDFASGTSSKSSKLVHGGLRYLEQREFGLVREASIERDLLKKLAPQLIEPIPFVLPVVDRWRRAAFGVGLWAYDALAAPRNLHVHKHLNREETEAMIPALPEDRVRGGYLYHDCRSDDARLVMEVLVAARRHGAVLVNHAPAVDLSPGTDVVGAVVRDSLSGRSIELTARRVVVAGGVWANQIESLTHAPSKMSLRPSKGVHLVFRRTDLRLRDAAAFIPDADRKRMLFVIPWLDAVLVGTTDTPYGGDIDSPAVDERDRRYCLDALEGAFHLGLDESHIAGAYAGLRPLIADRADETADLSRRHALYDLAPGILSLTGGKLTTYRRMAKDAVDRVCSELGIEAKAITHRIRLGSTDLEALVSAASRRASALGIRRPAVANLVRAYGDRALQVLDVAEAEGLTRPIGEGLLPIEAEAVYCTRAEMVVHLSDFLARRTRLALTDPAGGIGRGTKAADLLRGALGWSRSETRAEVEAHRASLEHERGLALSGTGSEPRRWRSTARTG